MSLFEQQSSEFLPRHIGPNEQDTRQMLKTIGEDSLAALVDKTVPSGIRMQHDLNIPAAMGEHEYLKHIPQAAKPMHIRVENGKANGEDIARTAKNRLFVRLKLES